MIALDTNVLIYACDKTDSKRQQRAIELITSAIDGVLLGRLSVNSPAPPENSETKASQWITPRLGYRFGMR
jgi:hypothetical protein